MKVATMTTRRRLLASLSIALRAPTFVRSQNLVTLSAVAALSLIIAIASPSEINWRESFYAAGQLVLHGHSPYGTALFFNPPWALLLVGPLTLLPYVWGKITLSVLTTICMAYAALRLGASRLTLACFLMSKPAFLLFSEVNLDGLVMLGLVLPPEWGLLLVMLKPQLGAGVAMFWAVEAWRTGGARKVIRTFLPLILLTTVSLFVFGNWMAFVGGVPASHGNASLFPLGLCIGVALLVHAIRSRQLRFAIPSTPFLSPYVGATSWSFALLPLVTDRWLSLAVSLSTWAAFAIPVFYHP